MPMGAASEEAPNAPANVTLGFNDDSRQHDDKTYPLPRHSAFSINRPAEQGGLRWLQAGDDAEFKRSEAFHGKSHQYQHAHALQETNRQKP